MEARKGVHGGAHGCGLRLPVGVGERSGARDQGKSSGDSEPTEGSEVDSDFAGELGQGGCDVSLTLLLVHLEGSTTAE